MKYQTVIITGLNTLQNTQQELFNYITKRLDCGCSVLKKSFKELNYYISDLKFNVHNSDQYNIFLNNTLIIWVDSKDAKSLYDSIDLFNSEIKLSKTTIKLIDGIDNIYFDTSIDDYYITIIPTIKKLLSTESKEERTKILNEFS